MHHLHRMIVFSLLGTVQYLSCCLILYQATLITMSILGTLKFSVLVVHFVIWQKCGRGSEHFSEEDDIFSRKVDAQGNRLWPDLACF